MDELDEVAEIRQLRASLPEGLREQVERELLSSERLERESNRVWREYGLRAYGIRRAGIAGLRI